MDQGHRVPALEDQVFQQLVIREHGLNSQALDLFQQRIRINGLGLLALFHHGSMTAFGEFILCHRFSAASPPSSSSPRRWVCNTKRLAHRPPKKQS